MASDDSLGFESSLSSWAGPYVTDMLGRGRAVASQPYQSYSGPLTAGGSVSNNKHLLARETLETLQVLRALVAWVQRVLQVIPLPQIQGRLQML